MLFLIYSTVVFADDNDSIIINNLVNGDKIKITLLRPCVVIKKEVEKENKNISDISNNQENNISESNASESSEMTNAIKEMVDNDKGGVKNKSNEGMENFLDTLGEEKNKNIEKLENPKKTITKMILQDYFNIDSTVKNDKANNERLKLDKILNSMYEKIISNLDITNLYISNYNKNSCHDMTEFFEKINDSSDISEYIFSDDFIDNDFVVSTELEKINETEIKMQLFLWDVLDEKFLGGKYYILQLDKNNNSYRISNMISDFIFKATTGEKEGLFDSKIMYVSETGSPLKREKQIVIMNFDGSKNTKITKSKNLKLIPIFSKYNPNEIFYMEYLPEGPFIVRHDLTDNSATKILTKDQVMTSAANFNPNGENQLILAGTSGKSTNLFLFDFKERKNKQITTGNSINTAPSFSPDGKKIVYVSDKSGSRKLYMKNLENNKEELLTKESGVYDKPSWSPDGKLIAFIKLKGQQFQLGIMNYRGEAERILTSSYLIEGVKWSPNSRYLIYTKQKGAYGADSIPRIYIKDILTGNEYRLQTPIQEGASDPDWVMNK